GEIEEAEKFYRQALSLIPEVDRSYNYFVTRDKNDEEERRNRLKDYIQKAETAFAQSSFTETLDNYAKALEYLPETPAVIQSMINQVRQSGFQLGFAGLQRTESQNANGPLNAGNELMSNQKFNEAILAYIDVINRFPKSTQVKAALEGIRKAVDAKNQANQSSSAQLQASLDGKLGEIETLKQEQAKRDDTIRQLEASLQHLEEVRAQERAERDARISEAETEISQLKTQLQEKGISSTDQTRTLEERLDELQNQLGAKEAELQRLTNERNSLQNDKNDLIMTRSTMERELNDLRRENDVLKRDVSSLENQITTLKTSADTRTVTTLPQPRTVSTPNDGLQKDLDNLTQIERDFTNIQKRYERYSVLEDNVLAKDGNTGLLQTKLYLDEFLTYEPVETAFPGLWRRIKVYDKAFEREGQVAAFQDIIDVVDVLARVEGDNRRVSLLDEEINRNSDDPLKRELLQELKTLLQAN
ncbi:MAG TPA: hypothetical protein VMX75_07095, partial [Spirochaetia bacterium]|nr:hypothetical protein [Spirochaetia bacterium]